MLFFSQINNKIKLYDWEGVTPSFFAIANYNYTLTHNNVTNLICQTVSGKLDMTDKNSSYFAN